jgi:hypothetical protein
MIYNRQDNQYCPLHYKEYTSKTKDHTFYLFAGKQHHALLLNVLLFQRSKQLFVTLCNRVPCPQSRPDPKLTLFISVRLFYYILTAGYRGKMEYRPIHPSYNQRTMLHTSWYKDKAASRDHVFFVFQPELDLPA